MLPIVSIVTPSFNQGQFLRRTIESVLTQDYPRLEYLVLDGGSSDESVSILHSYGERFYWRSQPDGGQSNAINEGLRRTTGEIVTYLNSDDVLLPGALATVVEHFKTNPEWDVVYGNARLIDENDAVLGDYPTAPFAFDRLLEDCCICQPAAFWRRRTMERVGLLDEALHYAMDYEYWMRVARAGGVFGHVPEVLASSRMHSATKTQSARINVYREILEVSRRHAGDASFRQYYAYWHHRCHERATGWPRFLRWLPECHWWLAYLHRRAYRARNRAA